MFTLPIDSELKLKIYRQPDLDTLFEMVDRNREHLRPWMGWADDRDRGKVESFIKRGLDQVANNNGFQAGIWYRDQLAGSIGFHYWNFIDGTTELGYWLDQDMQGRGIMTRACAAMIDFAFDEIGLNRVEIHCVEENTKSRAVPERLGFTQEGIMRHSVYHLEKYQNMVIYGLLKSEWKQV